MATIDPNIAMGYRPIQIENPLNQYAAISQIQGAQQGQQLNALKMRQAQQEFESQNALANAYKNAITPEGNVNYNALIPQLAAGGAGSAIPGVLKTRKETEQAAATLEKTQTETKAEKLKLIREKTADLVNNPSPENIKAHAQDGLIQGAWTPEQADNFVQQALSVPIDQRAAFFKEQSLNAEKRITTAETARTNLAREKNAAEQLGVSKGQLGVAQGNLGVAQQRLANETNPEMIRLKSESTELGKLAAGQSPLAPKVIAADAGKNLVGDVATQMGNSYLKLFEAGGIKSTTRGASANLAASSQSSMLGQIGGSILGTENQSERDFIKSQRPILVQGIVKATGMTASQINSNVELKNLLDAATDPDKGYETNAKNLNLINKRFGTGKNIMPEKPNEAAKTPNVEALLKKYE